jgi:cytochrome c556
MKVTCSPGMKKPAHRTTQRKRRLVGKAVFAAALGASALAYANQDAVDYRKHIMSTMGEQVKIIGMILEERAPADDFATHVEILAITAATAKSAFEPEAPGGDARPEIWQEWPDFARRLDELSAATAELAELAKDGGVAAAGPELRSTLTCKGCHDEYRVPDE